MRSAFPHADDLTFDMTFKGEPYINLSGLSMDKCRRLIQAYATSVRNCDTLALAEEKVQHTTVDLGGDYRDLLHLLSTEIQAALLEVERRHFESQFTSC